jgi:hypothetical protein
MTITHRGETYTVWTEAELSLLVFRLKLDGVAA